MLVTLFGCSNQNRLRVRHWELESTLKTSELARDPGWSRSIAVDSNEYIRKFKEMLGITVQHSRLLYILAHDEQSFWYYVNTFRIFPEQVFTIPEWVFTLNQNNFQHIVFPIHCYALFPFGERVWQQKGSQCAKSEKFFIFGTSRPVNSGYQSQHQVQHRSHPETTHQGISAGAFVAIARGSE